MSNTYHTDPLIVSKTRNYLPPIRTNAWTEPERQLPPLDTNIPDCSRQACYPRHSVDHHNAHFVRDTPTSHLPPTPPEDPKTCLYRPTVNHRPPALSQREQRAEMDAAYGLDTLRRSSTWGHSHSSSPHMVSRLQGDKEPFDSPAPDRRISYTSLGHQSHAGAVPGSVHQLPAHQFSEPRAAHQLSPIYTSDFFPPSPASTISPYASNLPNLASTSSFNRSNTNFDRLPPNLTPTPVLYQANTAHLPSYGASSLSRLPSLSLPTQEMTQPSTPGTYQNSVGPVRITRAHDHRHSPYPTPSTGGADANSVRKDNSAVAKLTAFVTKDGIRLSESGKIVYENTNHEAWEHYTCASGYCSDGATHVPPRKVISQFFGRNKACTLAIPDEIIPALCRKCYQQKTYRSKKDGSFYTDQAQLVRVALQNAKNWEGRRTWTIGISKTLQRAVNAHIHPTAGSPVSSKYNTEMLDFMANEFAGVSGPNKTEDDCLEALQLVQDACEDLRLSELPEFEFLAEGKWPELATSIERKKMLRSYMGAAERRNGHNSAQSSGPEDTPTPPSSQAPSPVVAASSNTAKVSSPDDAREKLI